MTREVRWKKSAGRRAKAAVTRKIEVVPAPVLVVPKAKGQAPTTVARGPLADDLRELLPPLTPAARERLVDALADLALVQLNAVNTDPDPEE